MDPSVARTVLVNAYTCAVPSQLRHAEFQVCSGESVFQPSVNELLAGQLSRLASQHHTSEYNCLKYGRGGLSAAYVPLCLYMPDYFNQLQSQQARSAVMQAWWPCPERTAKSRIMIHPDIACARGPAIHRPSNSTDLQADLLTAMNSPFTPRIRSITSPTANVINIKTSETNPINISLMVPPELLPIISANVTRADHLSPVMFNVPPSFQLHCPLASLPTTSSRTTHAITKKTTAQSSTAPRRVNLANLFWNRKLVRSTVVRPGNAMLSTDVPVLLPPRARNLPKDTHPGIFAGRDHTSTVSAFSQPVGQVRYRTFAGIYKPYPDYVIERSHRSSMDRPFYLDSTSLNKAEPGPTMTPAIAQHDTYTLGNLLLSSCPGKKVRVDGPTNGRPGVRRDVYQDMKRIKEFGAECIVCCLDNEELEFLGVPWEEYVTAAHGFGMDILRLPIPEGLAPADVEGFDRDIQHIIDAYTLRGGSVLVHCRGGLGRAGLFACCWMIRLGLCGWVDTQPTQQPHAPMEQLPTRVPPIANVRRDTLQLLEHVIALVRRRRSLKAIETFEQVKFLVEYVEFLRVREGQKAIRLDSVLERDIRMSQRCA